MPFARIDGTSPFKLSVEAVEEIVFFVRCARRTVPRRRCRTLKDLAISSLILTAAGEMKSRGPIPESHQRLFWYTFASLRCIGRSKYDGHLRDWALEKDKGIVSSISTPVVGRMFSIWATHR
ncbi:hypothetical protein BDV97DRAFT_370564 [Delphinella strobiligena]|nr:hypothetical protein BDV97DRAFT_370564 [Delphinella strobiligena]